MACALHDFLGYNTVKVQDCRSTTVPMTQRRELEKKTTLLR